MVCGDIHNMKTRVNRTVVSTLCLCCLMLCCLTTTVYATTEEAAENLSEMNAQFWSWYLTLRKIAFPILAVSYASCGFRILGAAFMSKGEQVMDSIKTQFLTSTLALFVLLCLPALMSETRNTFESTAWEPPSYNID